MGRTAFSHPASEYYYSPKVNSWVGNFPIRSRQSGYFHRLPTWYCFTARDECQPDYANYYDGRMAHCDHTNIIKDFRLIKMNARLAVISARNSPSSRMCLRNISTIPTASEVAATFQNEQLTRYPVPNYSVSAGDQVKGV